MLAEPYREILTAYVDGELPARQREAVLRLLHRSPEARDYLRQLQADAENLRSLPRRQLAPDFSQRVLQSIHDRNLRPGRLRPTRPVPVTLPGWVSVAAAAAVLLMVSATSYLYFARGPHANRVGPLVQGGTPTTWTPELPKDTGRIDDGGTALVRNDTRPVERPVPKDTQKTSPDRPIDPKTTTPEPDPNLVVAAPTSSLELFKPVKVPEVALPVVFKLQQLDQAKMRQELGKDTGFRLELPCTESVKAFARLQAAFKSGGPGLVIDPHAQFRLEHPQLKTHFVLYTEAVTPDELIKLLTQAAAEDRKPDARKRVERQFESIVLTRMSKDDRKELSDLLGVDPQKQPEPKPSGPLGVDPRKPLSEGTADQVAEALKGKSPERLALVLPYNPVRPRANSAELKRFLESLRQPRTGTIQLLLVLREMKS